jgi:hypothetical protein
MINNMPNQDGNREPVNVGYFGGHQTYFLEVSRRGVGFSHID